MPAQGWRVLPSPATRAPRGTHAYGGGHGGPADLTSTVCGHCSAVQPPSVSAAAARRTPAARQASERKHALAAPLPKGGSAAARRDQTDFLVLSASSPYYDHSNSSTTIVPNPDGGSPRDAARAVPGALGGGARPRVPELPEFSLSLRRPGMRRSESRTPGAAPPSSTRRALAARPTRRPPRCSCHRRAISWSEANMGSAVSSPVVSEPQTLACACALAWTSRAPHAGGAPRGAPVRSCAQTLPCPPPRSADGR